MVETLNQPQIDNSATILEYRHFSESPEGQQEIINFVDDLRKEVGDKESWEKTCQKVDEILLSEPVNESMLKNVFTKFQPYIDNMPPGHDPGHLYRDFLNSVILFNSVKDNCTYQSDAYAGLISGFLHDIGTSITFRYKDFENGAGHAEVGAYLCHEVLQKSIDPSLLKLICYSVAAHTHLDTVKYKFPKDGTRESYWDETWTTSDQKLCGIALQICRRSDRLETNGNISVLRGIISRMDAVQVTGEMEDLSGDKKVKINLDNLGPILDPVMHNEITPTALEHTQRFADSNFKANKYSEKDYLFPKFQEFLKFKLNQFEVLKDIIADDDGNLPDTPENFQSIHKINYKISQASPKRFEAAWTNFETIWQKLSSKNKSKWIAGFRNIDQSYTELFRHYRQETANIDFANLTSQVISELEADK